MILTTLLRVEPRGGFVGQLLPVRIAPALSTAMLRDEGHMWTAT